MAFSGPTTAVDEEPVQKIPVKNKEVLQLSSYSPPLPAKFWQTVPFREIPGTIIKRLNIQALSDIISDKRSKLKDTEYIRGLKAIDFLSVGAPSYHRSELPPVYCENAKQTLIYGAQLTDTIVDWIKKGFAAGPFDSPPLKGFRVNPLMVIPRNGKARPVLNVSSPAGSSYNDNVNVHGLEKVHMSSPRNFSYSVLKAGRNAIMSKFDMKDAYKNVPCKLKDIRLQGFQWGGKYFAETAQIFGATPAVTNYDILGNTVATVAKVSCQIPSCLVHRQIDDVPVVAPATTTWCQDFTTAYKQVCDSVGIQLAEDCPNKDKAFKNSTFGKVLGMEFRTTDLTWKLPEDKKREYSNLVHEAIQSNELSVLSCQKLLGKLNFVCSLAPWAKSFLRPLQLHLTALEEGGQLSSPLSAEAKKDLYFWWAYLNKVDSFQPLAHSPEAPPLQYKCFTTDAAGWKADGSSLEVGLGGVGLNEEGIVIYASQVLWNSEEVLPFFDTCGKYMGNKTTTLEFTGILIPFLLCLDIMMNQHIVIQVDNIACHYAWERGYAREDNTASVLVRILLLLCARLACVVHVVHHPRESSWDSRVADRLSRARSTTRQDRALLDSFDLPPLPASFRSWMRSPTEDWNLPVTVLSDLLSHTFLPE